MATHDYIIANASGAAVRADLNNALAAIVSNNSNATAPATTYAYQWWADTTANQLKLRNSANTDWIVIQELDGTMLMEDGTAAAPGLAFADDVDTGLFRPAANQLGVATNGVERVEFGTTEVVFNDSGANVDFRVEGDAEANLLFVDAGNDHVGIAESAPGTVLEVGSTEPYVTLKNSTEEDTDGGRESRLIFEGEQSGGEISTLAQIEVSHDGTADDEKGKVVISTNDGSDGASPTAALTISADQTVAVADNLTVNGSQYPTAGATSHRNLVINGACMISQRGTSHTGVTSSEYNAVDRFLFGNSNLGTWTCTRTTIDHQTESFEGDPIEFDQSFKMLCTTADASPAAGDALNLTYRLGGADLQHLVYGSSNARPVTISFYVKSNKSGAADFECQQYVSNAITRRINVSYTINAANTWEYKTITIPGDTGGNIPFTTNLAWQMTWWLNGGSDFTSGTMNSSWHDAGDSTGRVTNNIGIGGAVNDYFQMTGLQMEVGTKATPFEHLTYREYFRQCLIYYQSIGSVYGAVYGGSGSMVAAQLSEWMRATPTVTATYTHSGTISTNFTSVRRYNQYVTGDTSVKGNSIRLDAEL